MFQSVRLKANIISSLQRYHVDNYFSLYGKPDKSKMSPLSKTQKHSLRCNKYALKSEALKEKGKSSELQIQVEAEQKCDETSSSKLLERLECNYCRER